MWVPETWESEEDVDKDILLMAEYCVPTAEDLEERNIRVPDTILKYRRQMAANLAKPLNSVIDESACYIVSGRVKEILGRVIRPGELIEESLKARSRSPDQASGNESMFKLIPSASSSSSDSSTQTVTPRQTMKRKTPSSSDNGNRLSSTIVPLTGNLDNKRRS